MQKWQKATKIIAKMRETVQDFRKSDAKWKWTRKTGDFTCCECLKWDCDCLTGLGTCDSFSKKLIIDKVEITDTKTIANSFNNFFVKIGPNLASKIPKSDTNFAAYVSKANTKLHENTKNGGRIFESI